MYCKKTKEWKYYDYDNRDAPAIWYNNTLLIGHKGSTHATMIQEMLYGMNFEEDYCKLYEKKWNGEETEINFGRTTIGDDSNYIFGHVVGKEIYWDTFSDINKECFLQLKNNKDKEYTHYMVSEKDKAKELVVYRLKDYSF